MQLKEKVEEMLLTDFFFKLQFVLTFPSSIHLHSPLKPFFHHFGSSVYMKSFIIVYIRITWQSSCFLFLKLNDDGLNSIQFDPRTLSNLLRGKE